MMTCSSVSDSYGCLANVSISHIVTANDQMSLFVEKLLYNIMKKLSSNDQLCSKHKI